VGGGVGGLRAVRWQAGGCRLQQGRWPWPGHLRAASPSSQPHSSQPHSSQPPPPPPPPHLSMPWYSCRFFSGRCSSRSTKGRPLMYSTGSSRALNHSTGRVPPPGAAHTRCSTSRMPCGGRGGRGGRAVGGGRSGRALAAAAGQGALLRAAAPPEAALAGWQAGGAPGGQHRSEPHAMPPTAPAPAPSSGSHLHGRHADAVHVEAADAAEVGGAGHGLRQAPALHQREDVLLEDGVLPQHLPSAHRHDGRRLVLSARAHVRVVGAQRRLRRGRVAVGQRGACAGRGEGRGEGGVAAGRGRARCGAGCVQPGPGADWNQGSSSSSSSSSPQGPQQPPSGAPGW
jgi:hypothetical protein